MKQRFVTIFAVLSIFSLLFPHESEGLVGLKSVAHWGAKGVAAGVKSSAAIGKGVGAGIASAAKSSVAIPIIGAKKALLLAPIAIPLAIGSKAILAAKLAVPMGIGAAIGAPIGALIGAKAGALKGALIGKAIIAAKVALAKKAAVKAAAIAIKPVVLVAGVKAKIAGAKLGLIAKGVSAAGAAVSKVGSQLSTMSNKFSGFTSNLAQTFTPSLPKLSLPAMPVLLSNSEKGPTSLQYSFVVNGPHTGFKSKNVSLVSNRRRREASPDAEPEPQGNAQQLLQLVRSQNAQQCLQRVICELSANPNAHGNEGVRFGRSLILLESQTDRAAAQQYRQAHSTGTGIGNGQLCSNFYPSCAFQSNEIIRIGNQMIEG